MRKRKINILYSNYQSSVKKSRPVVFQLAFVQKLSSQNIFLYFIIKKNLFTIMKILFLLFALAQILVCEKKLVMIQELFRHGARYPIFMNEKDGSMLAKEKNSIGQLTTQGKNMHYLLGKILYKKYWDILFNGTAFQQQYNQSQFYVKSTDVNRTIESVESQLFGWLQNLPPLQLKQENYEFSQPAWGPYHGESNVSSVWEVFKTGPVFHPIPIHVEKKGATVCDDGDFLRNYDAQNCPKQIDWIKENMHDSRTSQVSSSKRVTEAVEALSKAVGKNIPFTDVYKYKDSQTCLKYMSEDYLPIFEDPKYKDTFDFIQTFSMYQSLYSQPEQIRAVATNFMKRTKKNIDGKMAGNFTPKIVLYSAHDTTVGMVLAAFNFTSSQCILQHYLDSAQNDESCVWKYPIFTSNIILELWKDADTYTIKILYNGEPRKVPFCNYQEECTIEQFQSFYNGFVVSDAGEACGLEDDEGSGFIGSVIFLVIVILCLVAYILYSRYKMKKFMEGKEENKDYQDNFEEKQQELESK